MPYTVTKHLQSKYLEKSLSQYTCDCDWFLAVGMQNPSLWVIASLVPIVGGVALVSFTEASFNW